jgi:hypothetical protein
MRGYEEYSIKRGRKGTERSIKAWVEAVCNSGAQCTTPQCVVTIVPRIYAYTSVRVNGCKLTFKETGVDGNTVLLGNQHCLC